MTLTYTKARIAAVLELPPSKPNTDGLSRAHKLQVLKGYRVQIKRWRKIEDLLQGVSIPYRIVDNAPAMPGQRHGAGTLHAPEPGSSDDCSIVHTSPNRAQRRSVGGNRVSAQRRHMLQVLAASEARENIARGYRVHGRWQPAEPGSIARLGDLTIGAFDLAA